MNPEAAYPGGVCLACWSVRTMSELDEQAILTAYEQEMLHL